MSSQLDILALEPFYGGVRRSMLETVIRCSRHRWTLLKLPPRRIERRLTASATWFSEQLSRHWVGRVDLLFTSDALNLADFYRLMPNLASKPAVVYFHDNQLTPIGAEKEFDLDLIYLSTASAATEIWFNSLYHLKTFMYKAAALVQRHPELASRSPMAHVTRKANLMPPPMDLALPSHVTRSLGEVKRNPRTIFVETRDADCELLNNAFASLVRCRDEFDLVTVGPVERLAEELPRTTIPENDEMAQVHGMLRSGMFVSARPEATFDHHAIKALSAGCWPVVPESGFYPELVPDLLRHACVYDGTPGSLADRIQDYWMMDMPEQFDEDLKAVLRRYDAIPACRAMDERFEELVAGHGAAAQPVEKPAKK